MNKKQEISPEIEKLSEELSGSYWNYRWIKFIKNYPEYDDEGNQTGKIYQEVYYELHEVYYDENEKPFMWSENAETLYVEDAKEMMEFVGKAINAAFKKVLIIENSEIKELKEYMSKSEILKNKIKEKRNEKKARRN